MPRRPIWPRRSAASWRIRKKPGGWRTGGVRAISREKQKCFRKNSPVRCNFFPLFFLFCFLFFSFFSSTVSSHFFSREFLPRLLLTCGCSSIFELSVYICANGAQQCCAPTTVSAIPAYLLGRKML